MQLTVDASTWSRQLRRYLLPCALIIVFSSSCARFQPRPLSAEQSAEALENRNLTNEVLKAYLEKDLGRPLDAWPLPSWNFESLCLIAYRNSPALKIARAQYEIALGGEQTAAQRPNPSLNVTPGYSSTTSIPSPWLPLAFVDVPIETAGKRRHRREEAGHLAEAARNNVATVAWQVRSSLRLVLLDLSVANARLELLRRQFDVQGRILAALDQQVKAGAKASSDALSFRAAAMKSRIDLADAERFRAEAQARVAESLGVPASSLGDEFRLAPDWLSLPDPKLLSTREVRREALNSRCDVLTALSEYAASEAALHLQIAKQYPDLKLSPGYQYDQGNSKWTLGMTVELPILNQNQGPIAEAEARRKEAEYKFEAVQVKVLAEIDRAGEVLSVSMKNQMDFGNYTAEQRRKRDAIAAQMKAGAVEQLELLAAELDLASAELLQLDGELKLKQAVAGLEDAVQRPLDLPAAILADSAAKPPVAPDHNPKPKP